MTKTYHVEPVTRLEGHAGIILKMSDKGDRVEDINFNVTSSRFFEKFVEGRYAEHVPRITPRICGICPIPHHMTATKAVEAAWGIEIPEPAEKLRRLLMNAKQYSSHLLHFFALAAPDFLYGPFASPAKRNVVSVINDMPDVGKMALQMMDFGQQLCAAIGAKAVHPVVGIVGGMKKALTEEQREHFLGQIDQQLEFMEATAKLAVDVVEKYWDVVAKVAVVPLYYCSVAKDGVHEIYDGDWIVTDPEGKRTAYNPTDYLDVVSEHVSSSSYATHCFVKDVGYPEGMYVAGPLAMVNGCERMKTPMAQSALKQMREKVGSDIIHNQFAYHWARIIEAVEALERVAELLKDPAVCSENIKTLDVEPKAGRGVGFTEAPRGNLLYDIHTDEDGICTQLNLLVATNHNIGGINKVLAATAKGIFEEDVLSSVKLPEPFIK